MTRPIKVMFFCLGNICRSPLGEGLFLRAVADRGLADRFEVASSGTSGFHVGESPDPGSVRVARAHGVDITNQRAQKLTSAHLTGYDYVVGMSASNMRDARRMRGAEAANLLLLRDFEPDPARRGLDTPDPYYIGGDSFDEVYGIVDRCVGRLLDHIVAEWGLA